MYEHLNTPGEILARPAVDLMPEAPQRSFAQFMKQNKVKQENVFYPATKSLVDENGEPLLWELRMLTTAEDGKIRDDCTRDVPVTGKRHMRQPKLDTELYMAKMLAASVVFPNLMDAGLQDSYGVKKAEDLIREMVDSPGEYQEFTNFVTKLNGFNVEFDELVEEAKN